MQNGIKHVVNLVDWEEKSKERDKFFSKRFALVLERAFNEIQEDKQRLKDSIRKFYGESKVWAFLTTFFFPFKKFCFLKKYYIFVVFS